MFRRVFARWGLPDRVRVDNGYPWGTPRDLPSELAMWLIGLGVEPIWNPPGQPTCNPKVERSNGLTQQWGELQTCADCDRRPGCWTGSAASSARSTRRSAAGPAPRCSRSSARRGASYRRAREAAMWDLARVDAFLARGCWRRHADGNGVISLYGHGRSVGRPWAGQELVVRFDASARCWLVSDPGGELIKQLPARELTRERILALAVSRRSSIADAMVQNLIAHPMALTFMRMTSPSSTAMHGPELVTMSLRASVQRA